MSPLDNEVYARVSDAPGRRRGLRLIAAAALAGWVALPATPALVAGAAVAPAGVAQPFAAVWGDVRGAEYLGAPVTAPIERDGDLVQYFAHGILRGAADGSGVDRVAAGYLLAGETYDPEAVAGERRAGGQRGSLAFVPPAGGFVVAPEIAGAYIELGGEARFGAAISRPIAVGDGWEQWFAFGRLVWRDGDAAEPALDGWLAARRSGAPVSETIDDTAALPTQPTSREVALPPAGFAPVGLAAPAIGLDAAIEQVGVVNGVMVTPKDAWNVGWYADLARPGRPGNVVFAGHRDWWGIGPTIFADLDQLQPGDEIVVTGRNGEVVTYVVVATWLVAADEDFGPVIAGDDAQEEITLITCAGSFDGSTYEDRLVVRGVRVD